MSDAARLLHTNNFSTGYWRATPIAAHYRSVLAQAESPLEKTTPYAARDARAMALETIVDRERPVLFVKGGKVDTADAAILGPEAQELVARVQEKRAVLEPLFALVGRIDDVDNFRRSVVRN